MSLFLGLMVAWVVTKEYQKRGLPHDHAVWWRNEAEKIKTADDINRYISAEIPDQNEDPELYELVTKFMIHGPCTKDKPCMQKDGVKCSKGFPKPFSPETVIIPNGFPSYRRRDNGRSFFKNRHVFTNQHVVPYNPFLLKKFRCHINVEYCGSLRSVAYIMKYVCKGNDKVAAVIQPPTDVNTGNINPPLDVPNEPPVDVALNEEALVEDLIMDEMNEFDNFEIEGEEENEERVIPLHDNDDLYVDPVQLLELIQSNQNDEQDDDFTDIHNYIDEVQMNEPQVDQNNNEPGTVENNFNRPNNFIAYDEIKRYISKLINLCLNITNSI